MTNKMKTKVLSKQFPGKVLRYYKTYKPLGTTWNAMAFQYSTIYKYIIQQEKIYKYIIQEEKTHGYR